MNGTKTEPQRLVIGMFQSVNGDEVSHIINGMYSKFITILFYSEALDWCYSDGCEFSYVDDGLLLMLNVCKTSRIQIGLCKGNL